ncbi:hypothetical protein [Neosynechococcus sphagnicola]|uniref:hypothetical protein n=1 Tax=Neosynechococcus sphagnicola TaxID=1501145 RepID=UPI000B0CA622|nr:hypothetical protein [Neosynechococcus sphagnicola]
MRQGDVLLFPMAQSGRMIGQRLSHLVLARGEVTGHQHRIRRGTAELYLHHDILYLKVDSRSATLTHEEHRELTVPQGIWEVKIQREYDPEIRQQQLRQMRRIEIRQELQEIRQRHEMRFDPHQYPSDAQQQLRQMRRIEIRQELQEIRQRHVMHSDPHQYASDGRRQDMQQDLQKLQKLRQELDELRQESSSANRQPNWRYVAD